ncbi:MAG: MltA domain-containing protein [Campylobacterota bacterium]|nr:MltA domain-containing protein [Campylobacterota bacterium]
MKIFSIALIVLLFAGCSVKQEPHVQEEKTAVEKQSSSQIEPQPEIEPKVEEPKVKVEEKKIKEKVRFKKFSKALLEKLSWEELESFTQDDLFQAMETFKKDCRASKRKLLLKEVCKKASGSDDSTQFFLENFYPYKLVNNDGSDQGLITGYYEPVLKGSLTKSEQFQHAVYKTPSNIITVDTREFPQLKGLRIRGKVVGNKLVRYTERKDMEQERNLEPICFVENEIDLFFMHIQGSGKVQLEDGKVINVNYASQNGRGYYAIGKELIKRKEISKQGMSLQAIKKWLIENPKEIRDILNLNKSYIFFKEGNKGATGALGTQLIAQRNIAVDRRYIPLGLPVFVQTTNPVSDQPINQLMVAADVGGAIKGKIRADFYWGTGDSAGEVAGRMKEKGTLTVLLPKEIIDAYNQ